MVDRSENPYAAPHAEPETTRAYPMAPLFSALGAGFCTHAAWEEIERGRFFWAAVFATFALSNFAIAAAHIYVTNRAADRC